jgi:phage recombination protein Bet
MCDKDLTLKEDTRAVAPVSEKTISDYLAAFGLATQLNKQEISQFVEVAKAFNLNPFKREIYCVPYKEGDSKKLSIIIGYETYLKRADMIPAFDGYETRINGRFVPGKVTKKAKNGGTYQADALVPDGEVFCECIVYRKDRKVPTKVEIDFNEYNQHNRMWESKPRTMIEKVAIAQAFRKAFPNEMGGMPYTSEELPEEMTTIRDVTPAPAEEAVQTPPEATVAEVQSAPAEPARTKATPEQVEKLKVLAKNFSPEELQALKADYGHDIDMLIDKMTEYSTPVQEQAQVHKWASPQVAEALKQSRPEQFEDDSKELYK